MSLPVLPVLQGALEQAGNRPGAEAPVLLVRSFVRVTGHGTRTHLAVGGPCPHCHEDHAHATSADLAAWATRPRPECDGRVYRLVLGC